MLTRRNRLTSSRLFGEVVRHGRRAGTRTLVVHLGRVDGAGPAAGAPSTPAQVGFVVGKAVGPAVVRNLVKRRLRHLTRERVESLPGSAVLVVRALPPAASAPTAQLARDLDKALTRLGVRAGT